MILMAILCVSLWHLYSQPLCISQQSGLLFYYFFSLQEINKGNPKASQQSLLRAGLVWTICHFCKPCEPWMHLPSVNLFFPSRSHLSICALRWRPSLLAAWKDCICCKLLAFIPGLPCKNPGFCVCVEACNCSRAPGIATSNPSLPSHWDTWVENSANRKPG